MAVNKEEIIEIIKSVEYPEITNTLHELGMLDEIDFNDETEVVSLTLLLPILNIPVSVRDMILNSIATEIKNKGSELSVSFAVMNEEQRQHFFLCLKRIRNYNFE